MTDDLKSVRALRITLIHYSLGERNRKWAETVYVVSAL